MTSIGLQATSRTILLKAITTNTTKALKVPDWLPARLSGAVRSRARARRAMPRSVCVCAGVLVFSAADGLRLAHAHPADGRAQLHGDHAIQRQCDCEWQVCSGRRRDGAYVCVCVHACTHARMCMYTHVHKRAHTHTHAHIGLYVQVISDTKLGADSMLEMQAGVAAAFR